MRASEISDNIVQFINSRVAIIYAFPEKSSIPFGGSSCELPAWTMVFGYSALSSAESVTTHFSVYLQIFIKSYRKFQFRDGSHIYRIHGIWIIWHESCHMIANSYCFLLGPSLMLISNGICQYERKYSMMNKNICQFLDRDRGSVTERDFRKKSKARKIYGYKWCNAALRIFSENTLGHDPVFWIFPGFTDKGYII